MADADFVSDSQFTNLTADEIANYLGHSMFSRLYEMSNGVETKGSDYRMEHH